jgi:dienelactone hydrolase
MRVGREIDGAGRAHSEQVTTMEVREAGVFGLYACPPGSGPLPGIVAFGGSGGGMGPTTGWAPALASRGFAVLAIAYFGAPGLPEALIHIEVEVVERAVGWLTDAGKTDGDAVGVIGMSRGSELALLASVLLDGVGPVVAFSPSGISWSGIGAGGPVESPAWTFSRRRHPLCSHDRRCAGTPQATRAQRAAACPAPDLRDCAR